MSRLGLQYWTPRILGKIARKLGAQLLADATINKSRLNAPRILVNLAHTDTLVTEVKFKAHDVVHPQTIEYDWFDTRSLVPPMISAGHLIENCDYDTRMCKPRSKPAQKPREHVVIGQDDRFQMVARKFPTVP